MKLTLTLSAEECAALRRLASEIGCSNADAAKTALRDWLIVNGHLDSATADNDNEDVESRGEV